MLNITLLTSVAKSALVGAVVTKLVDTFVSNKINNKIEHNKWLRSVKLELFSKLIEDILSLETENFLLQIKEVKRTIAKIILLVKDRRLEDKLEDFLANLNKYSRNEEIDKNRLSLLNKEIISYLQKNINL